MLAIGLAGFAYVQRQQAIARSGEAKIELSRALMTAGNPPGALSAAIDGTHTIKEAGGSTIPAEAALYELFWSKPLPVATTMLNQASTGMPRISLASLTAESRRNADGKVVDVFCVPAARQDKEPAIGPDEYCLEFSSRGLVPVPPSGKDNDVEHFTSAQTVDEKNYTVEENGISLNLDGKIYKLGLEGVKSKANFSRITTCNDRWIIAQFGDDHLDKVTTILFDKMTNSQKILSDAPFVHNGHDPACHSHSSYITLIGRGGPIVLVDGDSGKSKVPDLRSFNTFRHGFEDPDSILSLSVSKDLVLFSGAEVARTAGEEKIATQPIIYQLSTGNRLATLGGHEHLLNSAVMAKSGKWAVTATEAGELRVWDVERAVRMGHGNNISNCKYVDNRVLHDFDTDDSVDNDDRCVLPGNDYYARILLFHHHEHEAIVALRATGGSKLFAIDASGNVLRETTIDVDLSSTNAGPWTMSGGNLLAAQDQTGNLKLMSISSLGEVLDTYGPSVRSVSRLYDRDGVDSLLIVDEHGVGELTIDRRGARPSWSYRKRDAILHTSKLAVVARLASKTNGANYDIRLKANGRLHARLGTYVYCSEPDSGWTYGPICAVMDNATGDPIGDHLCLAGHLADEYLYCLAQDRRSIEAYHFGKRKWITIASGAFVSPLYGKKFGKILLHVERFADCSSRIVLSYREHYNGGGGIGSPAQLVFDIEAEHQLMKIAPDIAVGTPGFCTADALMRYAERSEVGVKPTLLGSSPSSRESGAEAETLASKANGAAAVKVSAEKMWAEAYIEVGQKWIEAGDESAGEVMFGFALQHDPGAAKRIAEAKASAYFHRGNASLRARRDDEAKAQFGLALQLGSGIATKQGAELLNEIAWEWFLHSKPAEGLSDAEQAVSLAPKNPAILDTRGQIYLALGRIDEALADLNQVVQLGINSAGTWYARGRANELKSNLDAAIADYRHAAAMTAGNDQNAKYQKSQIEKARGRLVALGVPPTGEMPPPK
jgi:WD40 repeat protein